MRRRWMDGWMDGWLVDGLLRRRRRRCRGFVHTQRKWRGAEGVGERSLVHSDIDL